MTGAQWGDQQRRLTLLHSQAHISAAHTQDNVRGFGLNAIRGSEIGLTEPQHNFHLTAKGFESSVGKGRRDSETLIFGSGEMIHYLCQLKEWAARNLENPLLQVNREKKNTLVLLM